MDISFKDILVKILEVIEYKEDKEAFVNDFIHLTETQALINLIKTLSTEKQEIIHKELEVADTTQKAAEVVKEYFTDEQLLKGLEDASKNAMTEWMKAIDPTLSVTQKQKLTDLFKQLAPQAVQ